MLAKGYQCASGRVQQDDIANSPAIAYSNSGRFTRGRKLFKIFLEKQGTGLKTSAFLLTGSIILVYISEFCTAAPLMESGNNSVVECNLAKVEVASSNLVSRSSVFDKGSKFIRAFLCFTDMMNSSFGKQQFTQNIEDRTWKRI
jgi:hypothetical protein